MRTFYALLLSALSLFMVSCGGNDDSEKQTTIERPQAKELEVFVNIKENNYKGKSAYLTEFLIQNNSDQPLKRNWAIYFHQPRLVDGNSVSENAKVTHISGDYFKVEPTDSFPVLKKGESEIVQYESAWWAIKLVDAPVGLYITFTDSLGNVSQPEAITSVFYDEMLDEKQTRRSMDDPLKVPTAASQYEAFKKLKFTDSATTVPIIPTPNQWSYTGGSYTLPTSVKISVKGALDQEYNFLSKKLSGDYGLKAEKVKEKGNISLVLDTNVALKGDGYKLVVNDKGVLITGKTAKGVFYGIQSLRALVPVTAFQNPGKEIKIKNISIKDQPRFDYRGLHLDVARNFQKKDDVKKLIDIMAFYKLNKFHFHFIDDEGWRIQIKQLPELTEVGSKRGHTIDEATMLNPAYGSGPYPSENSHGTGYYTQEDFIEILKYAAERHIEVIPELDFPGHARAAIVSMKARQKRLIEEGKEKEANQYILHDPNDASTYESVQLYDDNVICVCQESTYRFLQTVLDEIDGMYTKAGLDLTTIHIGGDEVPHPTTDNPEDGAWNKSPNCKKILDVSEEYEEAQDLFYYFVDRFSKMLAEKDIVTAGWEEIGMKKVLDEDEEEYVPVVNDKFIERNFMPYVWNTVWGWGAEDRGYRLANAGYKVVLANVNNLYFDLAYNKHPAEPGYYWGGLVDTRKSWEFIPLDIYKGDLVNNMGGPVDSAYVASKVRLTEEGKKNIVGIQGQLWSETVKGPLMMEYSFFPKMYGLAERAWAQKPEWAYIEGTAKRNSAMDLAWQEFATRIGMYELPRLTYMNGGFNYRISPVGAVIKNDTLYANLKYPGFEIRFTTDGTDPTTESYLYSEPVDIDPNDHVVKIAAFDLKGRRGMVLTVERQ
jgi:hexosaminidase